MSEEEIFKELSRRKKVLEEKGYNVIYMGLHGSQNYNVDDEFSDIDVKAIILPSLHDIIFRKTTSTVEEFENGHVDVKDLITFYDVIKKGNFSYVEAIDTEYSIGDKYIKELFKKCRPNLKSMKGAMYEKRKALTHEYPSKHLEFQKWGFDPKQLHHIVRLSDMIRVSCALPKEEVPSYLKYNDDFGRKEMIDIKRNNKNFSLDYAIRYADEVIENTKKMIPEDYEYESINLDDEINSYIEKEIKKDLIKINDYMFSREVRTFGKNIPKKDMEKFKCLEKLDGQDISYIVFESIEVL